MEREADLFEWQPGDPPRPMTIADAARKRQKDRFGLPAGAAKGYADLPGTGPEGEACKTCANLRRVELASGRGLYKCELVKVRWTKGRATDVLLRAPACEKWQPRDDAGESQ